MPVAMKAVLIAGPTASGKSALALELADRFGGTVVNADSMQVYGGLRVITARPSDEEEAQAPHWLYGHVDAGEIYSTGRWLSDVADALAAIAAEGRLPIIVGGTGLYFKALTQGLAAVPAIPADIRATVRDRLESEGVAALYSELIERDPVTATRLMPLDRARIARALEVVLATGRSLSDWHKDGLPPLLDADRTAKVFITCDRKELVARIETRFGVMLEKGALDEVKALAARRLNPLLPAMKAHGVPWLIRHLKGELSLKEATEGSIMDTRRYAKRQLTWFRGQMKDWPAAEPDTALEMLSRNLQA
ncbi:MAG: tRNA (adenosine(37)-N6)-dimethylallyltransferase MiaA [Pseudolabrys sp.]|nr:tRNA (adenosine(37)-N6)-dimethylallyltransferase MiaA [Pseudolabrys sp.]MDP2295976.1 tRNA (adenosine(37)-N6)-dimethylallyltransferase MiaA [Pseudolabrys sp.]